MEKWLPKSIFCLRANYTRRDLLADLIAGVTVGLVALPLAMAFGIASGVTPQAGFYTAVVAGFLISALGGSRLQIGGPTGAFVVIVAGIVAAHGVSGLLMVTFMAGLILILMAVTGLGLAVKYIPRPVTIGFTNGIAVLIASTQVKDFLGLDITAVPSEFVLRMAILMNSLRSFHWSALLLGIGSLLLILLLPRFSKRVPGSIVALVLATIVVPLFGIPVETIGSKFGGIPTGLPYISLPQVRPELIMPLLPAAVTVAMLAAIESLLSAVVADSMSGDKHNSNVELLAQGVANLAVPFVGGIPATGAIARTATNIRTGARTPVSGMVHALTLLVILLVAAPLARFIPLATLAAILFVVAYNMSEWREVRTILRLSKADIVVWMMTFGLTVLADLTVAVEIGILLAALLYIYRVSQTTTVAPVTEEYIEDGRPHILQDKLLPSYVLVLRIHGPFLFGATEKLSEATVDIDSLPPVVILRLRNMTAIDATGLHELEKLAQRLRDTQRTLLLCGARSQPAQLLRQSPFLQYLGAENMLPHVESALSRAREVYEGRVQPALAPLEPAARG
ncbi:MAG TPA: SulP family inorganic anion transporter [Pyrinomonadaceae bacterium]|nr:SulP family inorganic anion transporter [Pyrinomonadaceae bacterium]